MNAIKEFKEFAVKGNVIDLAIAVMMGAAFGAIVTSLVNDIFMPPLGLLVSGVDFAEMVWVLKEGPTADTTVSIRYGAFLQKTFSFLVIAGVIFLLLKGLNKLKRKAEDVTDPEVPTPMNIQLLSEIRDLLKQKG